MQQHKKVYLLTNQLERVVSGEIYVFYIYFGVQNVNIFVSHFRHFHYTLYYLHLTIDLNCYADKIVCNENNIWKMQHKNIFLDKGKKPEKSWPENEHEFMFSLVKNNFLLMLTVAAQAVCCEGVGIVDRMPVLEKQETSPHCSRRGISAQSDYCIRQPATLFCK